MSLELITAIVFIGTVLLVVLISQFFTGNRRSLSQRMAQYGLDSSTPSAARETLQEPRELFPTITNYLQRYGQGERLRMALARAAIPMRPSEFIVVSGLLVVVPTFIALLSGAGPLPILAIGVIGWILPKIWLKSRETQRIQKFEQQLADGLSLISAAIRSGYSFLRALQLVADELAPPISEECERVVRQANLGVSTEDALKRLLQRVPSYNVDLVVTAVLIQMQTGGNLAEVLENISDTIRERAAIQGEIQVLTAEARMSMLILSLLPFFMVGLLLVVNPGYIGTLLQNPLGQMMLGIAVLFQIFGVLVMKRMVELDV